jgi:hypothetical protein
MWKAKEVFATTVYVRNYIQMNARSRLEVNTEQHGFGDILARRGFLDDATSALEWCACDALG